jgi:hypothetical protein
MRLFPESQSLRNMRPLRVIERDAKEFVTSERNRVDANPFGATSFASDLTRAELKGISLIG